MEIASVNGSNNISNDLKHYMLSKFSESTPNHVSGLATILTKEKLGNTITIVTKPFVFYSNYPDDYCSNREHSLMKRCIANGANICSILGICFAVKDKKDYEREWLFPHKRTGKVVVTYTITLKNVETNQLETRAKAYRISYENNIVQQIRSNCNNFYQHICASPVVESVAMLFVKKIKEKAENRFINTFHIYVGNQSIALGEYEENYVYFSFAENGLSNLSEKNQRLGFCLAVIDKISACLNDTPVLSSKTDSIGQTAITNKMHIISRSKMDEKFTNEEFELIFDKNEQKKPINNWY